MTSFRETGLISSYNTKFQVVGLGERPLEEKQLA
jgi:hypothetical protein